MSDDLYVKLCARLNENAMKLPPVGSVITFLKEIFTEEHVRGKGRTCHCSYLERGLFHRRRTIRHRHGSRQSFKEVRL